MLLGGQRRCPRVSTFPHRLFCPKVYCTFFFLAGQRTCSTSASTSLSSNLLATVQQGASVTASLSVSTRHSTFVSVTGNLSTSTSITISPVVIASIIGFRLCERVRYCVEDCLKVHIPLLSASVLATTYASVKLRVSTTSSATFSPSVLPSIKA